MTDPHQPEVSTPPAPAHIETDPDLAATTQKQIEDVLEEVVPLMPIVLPLMGAGLIFMLAFIAVYVA